MGVLFGGTEQFALFDRHDRGDVMLRQPSMIRAGLGPDDAAIADRRRGLCVYQVEFGVAVAGKDFVAARDEAGNLAVARGR